MNIHLSSRRRELLIGAALLAVPSVSLAQSDPPFYFLARATTTPIAKITEAEFADLDGDGDYDGVLWAPDAIRIYKKEGLQPYTAAASPPTAPQTGFRGARIGDVDSDGDPDLAVCAETPAGLGFVEIFMNDGTAAFSSAGRLSIGAAEAWSHPTFGDIDGNGELDLIAYEDVNQNYTVFWDVQSPSPPSPSTLAASAPDRAAQLHDFDGDGDLDVLFGSTAAGIFWAETFADTKTFGTPRSLGLGGRGRAVGDLDSDGDLEIIAAVSGGPVYFENLGSGQFGPFQRIVTSSVSQLGDCRCVDLNLDGNLDLAFFTGNGALAMVEGDGAGGFGPIIGGQGPSPSSRSIEFGDHDGDGDLDAVVSSEDQTDPTSQGTIQVIENIVRPLAAGPCGAAVPLLPGQVAYVDPSTAVASGTPWPCSSSAIDSWYSYTVPPGSDSFTAVVSTIGNSTAPVAIYEGTCANPVPLICDIGPPIIGSFEVTANDLVPLQTYLIRVGVEPANGDVILLSAIDNGGPPATCVNSGNASFESGDLNGWTFSDIGGAFVPMGVAAAGSGPGFGLFRINPTSGQFAFRTGFGGDGPGTISLSQEIDVTPAVERLTFNYRAGWSILNPAAAEDRTFSVVVRDAVGNVLQSNLYLTAAAQTTVLDTGSRVASIDLSQYLGQTVELCFEWHVPESNTGPAHFQLDNITCPGAENTYLSQNYCDGVFNSTGFKAEIRASGSRSAVDNSFTLTASKVPPGQFGIFIVGTEFGSGAGNSNGPLCVGGSIGRFNVIQAADAAGTYSMPIDLRQIPQGIGTTPVTAGQTWFFQSWYRDPQVGLGSNFTSAVTVLFN